MERAESAAALHHMSLATKVWKFSWIMYVVQPAAALFW
jgi:hypothetical protein